jgi:glycosyltransferase involved in cell wall biosynthesis
MGAISFSLDHKLVGALRAAIPLNTLVETGTFKGYTIAEFRTSFEKIISIELSESLWNDAVNRFKEAPHVSLLQGDSGSNLRKLQPSLQGRSVLYWLDAHWCVASDTAGEASQCPLLEELRAIGKLNANSVVLIDDARLFLAAPLAPHEISHWPTFHQIVTALLGMSDGHELMVVNDVIVFYPKQAESALVAYAQANGCDWLGAANCLKQGETLMRQLIEKEQCIQELDMNLCFALKESQEQKTQLKNQAQTLLAYELAYGKLWFLRPIARIVRRTREVIRPRLGKLNQYSPRPILLEEVARTNPDGARFPKISIVTPSYQQGAYIERTIRSVLDQQYPNLEYFVQDGGSNDGTAGTLKVYEAQLAGWVSEKDGGQSQAINLGLAKTTGEIMAWLNSDDLMLPGTLHTVASYFEKHPDVDVVYGNRLLIDGGDMEIGRWIVPGHNNEVLSWVDYVPQETLFWRRRIWEKVGGHVDESFHFAMDWDLLVRFRGAGAKFGHIPQFLGGFRIHGSQKTSAAINEIGHREMDRIRERILGRVPNHKEIRKAVRPYLVKHIAVDLYYRLKQQLYSKNHRVG